MSEHTKGRMALPAGRTCVDCVHFGGCVAFIGAEHIHDRQTRCDWSPSRFFLSAAAALDDARRDRDELIEALREAFDFTKYAAAIHFNPNSGNTQDWLDGMKTRIEALQEKIPALLAKHAPKVKV